MRQLYIRQKVFKILDHYAVTDAAGVPVYQVDQEFRFFGHTVHVTTPAGQPLFTINREIFTLLPRFVVDFANGRSISIRSRFTLIRRHIDIDPEDLGLELRGDFFSLNFSLYQKGNLVGSIHKAWPTLSDQYELVIHDESMELLFVAVVIALDRLLDEARNQAHSASSSNT
ncbi:MAG: LURP-one-related family protein [Bacillota bacterium]|nr:LURP-one-related family protein [Bacillota bacterium]